MDRLAQGGREFKDNIKTSVTSSENAVVVGTRAIVVEWYYGGIIQLDRHERSDR